MKKTLIATLLMIFGIGFQAQAVNTNSNSNQANNDQQSGVVAETQIDQIETSTEDNDSSLGNEKQNKVMNQGEITHIQTQEQNINEDAINRKDKENKGDTSNSITKGRSQVASAVQAMLQIADRDSGVGQQIRIIAQNQNQNQVKLEKNIENIKKRGGITKFFIGANYKEIKDARKTLEQNKNQIEQLNQIRTQLINGGDQEQLSEQIKLLEQSNQEIEALIEEAQGGFSLFGWLNKIVS